MSKVLLVIDLQNDYFPGGKYPLWNTQMVLQNVMNAIKNATARKVPVILIQHIANSAKGPAPFFNESTSGAEIHQEILAAVTEPVIIMKSFADSFIDTELEKTLTSIGATELLISGMMTQNCVTHTAISKTAEKYTVTVLADCCTTINEMIHKIALNALSARVQVIPFEKALE